MQKLRTYFVFYLCKAVVLQRVYATHKVLQLGTQIRAIAVVDDVVVGFCDGTALFEVFDLGNVAAVDLFRREGAHFAASKAFLADVAEIGRASVGKECVRRCRSRWSPYH